MVRSLSGRCRHGSLRRASHVGRSQAGLPLRSAADLPPWCPVVRDGRRAALWRDPRVMGERRLQRLDADLAQVEAVRPGANFICIRVPARLVGQDGTRAGAQGSRSRSLACGDGDVARRLARGARGDLQGFRWAATRDHPLSRSACWSVSTVCGTTATHQQNRSHTSGVSVIGRNLGLSKQRERQER